MMAMGSLFVVLSGVACFAGPEDGWQLAGNGYERDPRLPALLSRAREVSCRSLARIEDELGWKPGRPHIGWVFDVSRPPAPPPEPKLPAEPKLEERRFFDNGSSAFLENGGVQVTLPARKYLRHPEFVDQVIEHEAVHAVLASAVGTRERYNAIPRWFREGISLFFSGEGKIRLEEELAYALFQHRGRDSFLAGLPPAGALSGAAEVSSTEAYLALLWMERRLQASVFRSFLQEVARGRDFERSLETALGCRFGAFRAGALSFARKEIEKLLPAADEARFRESNRVAWTLLLKSSPQGPLGPTLHFLLAKEALPAGEGPSEEAKRHLEALLRSPQTLWRPEALLLLGECFEREGRIPAAREAWEEVMESFGEDTVPASKARERLGSAAGPHEKS